ncbi:gp53-like domain-containing protein, partial [Lonsdalea britannica]|uniref:gp53-like domain-containing protein n=1 Tax=Lonsdalea britannica TaxID=1082704 RepID=UPI003B848AA7
GLGEAAKRGVGTGQNQIPDMSSFAGLHHVNGWRLLPGGLILQWGQTTTGAASPVTVNFNIPFPTYEFCVLGSIYDDNNPSNTTLRRKSGPIPRFGAQFFLNNGTASTAINWWAVGM